MREGGLTSGRRQRSATYRSDHGTGPGSIRLLLVKTQRVFRLFLAIHPSKHTPYSQSVLPYDIVSLRKFWSSRSSLPFPILRD